MNELAILLLILIICVFLAACAPKVPKQEYGVKSVTVKGEEVKSIAERTISDYFVRNNIKYVYEPQELFYASVRPDFYLPDYDVYVEYWGLVDVDDDWTREEYVRRMKWKMA